MEAKWGQFYRMKLIYLLILFFVRPLHQFPARIAGHRHLVGLAIDNMVFNTPDIYASSEARRGDITRVSGQRPEQGADAKFFATQKAWAQGPYPAQ